MGALYYFSIYTKSCVVGGGGLHRLVNSTHSVQFTGTGPNAFVTHTVGYSANGFQCWNVVGQLAVLTECIQWSGSCLLSYQLLWVLECVFSIERNGLGIMCRSTCGGYGCTSNGVWASLSGTA